MALTWITWLLLVSVVTLQMFAVSDGTTASPASTSVSVTTGDTITNDNSVTTGSPSISMTSTTSDSSTVASTTISTTSSSSETSTTDQGYSSAETSFTASAASSIGSSSTLGTTASGNVSASTTISTTDDTPILTPGTWQFYAIVIGVPAAGVILLIIIIVVIVVCCKRCKRRKAADEESKVLERVTAPNGDLYTQVAVKGRGFQAIEMTPVKASSGQEYKRLSVDIPSDVPHAARNSKGTRSALITSTDYESLPELSLGGESGQAKETKICRESGETQPAEAPAEDVRESTYANPLAGGDNEVDYENCSDYLNGSVGDGKVSKGALEANKTTKRPSFKLEIVSLKKERSSVADKKDKSLKSPGRDAPSADNTAAEKPSAQDENPAAVEEARPDSDIYENASVVHDANKGSRRQEGTADGQAKRDSRAADDVVVVAKQGESTVRPSSKASSEDWLEDNILYESSRGVQELMNNVA